MLDAICLMMIKVAIAVGGSGRKKPGIFKARRKFLAYFFSNFGWLYSFYCGLCAHDNCADCHRKCVTAAAANMIVGMNPEKNSRSYFGWPPSRPPPPPVSQNEPYFMHTKRHPKPIALFTD